jgi:hypothetical protein
MYITIWGVGVGRISADVIWEKNGKLDQRKRRKRKKRKCKNGRQRQKKKNSKLKE